MLPDVATISPSWYYSQGQVGRLQYREASARTRRRRTRSEREGCADVGGSPGQGGPVCPRRARLPPLGVRVGGERGKGDVSYIYGLSSQDDRSGGR